MFLRRMRIMTKILQIVVITVFLCVFQSRLVCACINDDPCVCEISETKRIDLRKFSEKLKSDEFLEDERHGSSYFFHGCTNGTFNATAHKFNVNDTKKVFSGSLISVNTTVVPDGKDSNKTVTVNYVEVAKSSEIKFVPVEGQGHSYQLVYKRGENVTARIQLICSDFGTSFLKILSTDGTDPSFAFVSTDACFVTHQAGLSTGSILVILFFVCFGIYFIGGCLLMYTIRGARGLEIIPNLDFWRSLPGLVKDGIIFLFSGCNASSITTPETYDRI